MLNLYKMILVDPGPLFVVNVIVGKSKQRLNESDILLLLINIAPCAMCVINTRMSIIGCIQCAYDVVNSFKLLTTHMNNKESEPLILIISTVGAVGFVTKASRLFRKPAGFWAASYTCEEKPKSKINNVCKA